MSGFLQAPRLTKYTKQHLANWRRYEAVRQEGQFNMFDPNARLLTGLSKEAYTFCIKHYTALRELAEGRAHV